MNNRRRLFSVALSASSPSARRRRARTSTTSSAPSSRATTFTAPGSRCSAWSASRSGWPSPGGVSDVQLATFENAHFDDAAGLADIVRRNAGEPMQPLVQTRSNRNGETTLIYARPLGGDRVALLVFAHDRKDTTLVRVVVSMDKFTQAMNHPDGVMADSPLTPPLHLRIWMSVVG